MADRVFEDRLGLWIIDPARGTARLPAIKRFAGGVIRDLFWPRTASATQLAQARTLGFAAHLYVTVDGRGVDTLAGDTLADLDRLRPGALEANIELPVDADLPPYVDRFRTLIRMRRPNLRMRFNLGAWKGFATPSTALVEDANLYVCEQNYLGNMDELLSPADVLLDLLDHGAPLAKATVCYAADCEVLGSPARLRTLPDLTRRRRGVIYQDDLMADAGLL